MTVTNVTRNWTETLFYPDTVLILTNSTGVGEYANNNCLLGAAYPNPFTGATSVPLELAEAGDVLLRVIRVDGAELSSRTLHLDAGNHRVAVHLASPGMAFLTVTTAQGQAVTRLVNKGGDGSNAIDVEAVSMERGTGTGYFVKGDLMRYQASCTLNGILYSSQISEWQQYTENETVTLYFENLPNSVVPPTVTTGIVSSITQKSISITGTVTNNGGDVNVVCGMCWGTNPNPTLNNHHKQSSGGTNNFTTSVTGLVPGMKFYIRTYAKNSAGTSYGEQKTFTTQASTVNHNYVDLGLPSGTLWADCNIESSVTSGYDGYYGWGETVQDHYNTYSAQFTNTPSILLPEDDAAAVSWGANWRMPTKEQWAELIQYTVQTWTTASNGMKVKQFRGTNGNTISLPANGYQAPSTIDWATAGYYWSSTGSTTEANKAWYERFYSGTYGAYGESQKGLCIRPVRYMASIAYAPTVYTVEVYGIGRASAGISCEVYCDGGSTVFERGVCWSSTNRYPTISDSHLHNGTGVGSYDINITGLTTSTTYYVRAYAKNQKGTSYGQVLTFTTFKP